MFIKWRQIIKDICSRKIDKRVKRKTKSQDRDIYLLVSKCRQIYAYKDKLKEHFYKQNQHFKFTLSNLKKFKNAYSFTFGKASYPHDNESSFTL